MARYAVGVDLGGTKVEACLVDGSRTVLARKRRPSEPGLGRERVVANILGLVAETAGEAAYEAVGTGTPGTYHPGDDVMYGTPHTPLYEEPGLIGLLRSRLEVPLIVENHANCLALARASSGIDILGRKALPPKTPILALPSWPRRSRRWSRDPDTSTPDAPGMGSVTSSWMRR